MMRRRGRTFFILAFAVLALSPRLRAHPVETPPSHSGGFGEPDCTACHFDSGLRPAADKLRLDGLPAAYRPGVSYELTLRLRDMDMRTAGFLLSVRLIDSDPPGAPGGTLTPEDWRTEAISNGRPGVTYLRSRDPAVPPGPSPAAAWKFRWWAPGPGAGPVVFHLRANAGNGDQSPFGDHVYGYELVLPPAAPQANEP